MAARIGNIAFDCDDVLTMAAFWSAVLGRPVDKGSSEFFASIGGADAERREPALYFNIRTFRSPASPLPTSSKRSLKPSATGDVR